MLAQKDFNFTSEVEMNAFVASIAWNDTRLLSELVFVALVGIIDPIRHESYQQVQMLLRAHINVRIFTGDNKETAVSAARACGLITNDNERWKYSIIEGEFLNELHKSERYEFKTRRSLNPSVLTNENQLQLYPALAQRQHLADILSEVRVIAQASAKHKELLIQQLKLFDRIVCVTGDDAENAIAIQQAHIGVGLGGSETKSSIRTANVVLMNDSICGITESVSQGRSVFLVMKKMVEAFIVTGFNLYIFCLLSTVIERADRAIPLTSILLLSVCLNYVTHRSLILMNKSMKSFVMQGRPFQHATTIYGKREKLLVIYNVSLLSLELVGGMLLGQYGLIKSTFCGLLVVVHVEIVAGETPHTRVKLLGIVAGAVLIIIQWGVEYATHNSSNTIFYTILFYGKSIILVQLNLLMSHFVRPK